MKNKQKKLKPYSERMGLIGRLVKTMRLPGKTRKAKRMQARVFRKDPLKYNTENIGRTITNRGRFL